MFLEGLRNGLEKSLCRVTSIGENNRVISEYKYAIIDSIQPRERQTYKMNGRKEKFNSWAATLQVLTVFVTKADWVKKDNIDHQITLIL